MHRQFLAIAIAIAVPSAVSAISPIQDVNESIDEAGEMGEREGLVIALQKLPNRVEVPSASTTRNVKL